MSAALVNACAVIPTYNPPPALVERVRDLVLDGTRVLVVDDASPSPEADVVLDGCAAAGAEVRREPINAGIGRALNAGHRWATELRADYLLTLDQDTSIPRGYVSRAASLIEQLSPEVRVGLVAPSVLSSRPVASAPLGRAAREAVVAIQSGSVFPVGTLEVAGEFREDFVMDCLDLELCLRLRASGAKVVLHPDLAVTHALGDPTDVTFFGRKITIGDRTLRVSNHSDVRKYYMVRNRILLLRWYWRDMGWQRLFWYSHTRDIATTILFERQRWRKFRTIVQATWHGLRGLSGPRADVSRAERGSA